MNQKSSQLQSVACAQGEIAFELLRSDRKTFEINVYPNQSVVVRAPRKIRLNEVKRKVAMRADWIAEQVNYFAQRKPRQQLLYVDGESHSYLGRKYELTVINEGKSVSPNGEAVRLQGGRLYVYSSTGTGEDVQKLLEGWYRQKANDYFAKLLNQFWEDFRMNETVMRQRAGQEMRYSNLPPMGKPVLTVRKMKTRWGSLSRKDTMTLSLELIKAPRKCVEYVVWHELCHLLHRNHGLNFYRLLRIFLPDWSERKNKLEMSQV